MKALICAAIFSLASLTAVAQEQPQLSPTVVEFANAMGVEDIIDSTMQQTRDSMKGSIGDLGASLKAKFPNMSAEQSQALDEILGRYIDLIVDSIDAEQASRIYAAAIAEGMTDKEVETASAYYSSPEGQNLLEVVGVASTKMNDYMLGQITGAVKVGQQQLGQELGEFTQQLSAEPNAAVE